MLDAAIRLFRAFHGQEPQIGDILRVRSNADDAVVVGELQGVIYKAKSDGKTYIHRFGKNARPVLAISSDGRQFYALAGAYRFTGRGFVDDKGKRRRK